MTTPIRPKIEVLLQADTLLVDSQAALNYALENGLSPKTKIYSASPSLAKLTGVIPLESDVDAKDIQRFSEIVDSLSQKIYQIVSADKKLAPRALTLARLAAGIENLAYRAWLLSRVDLGNSIVLIEHPKALPSLGSGWEKLLEKLPEFRGRIELPSERMPKISTNHNTIPPILVRLRFETWQSIMYRFLIGIPNWLKIILSWRGDIFIVSKNGLIKEAATSLGVRGFALQNLPKPPKTSNSRRMPKDLTIKLGKLVEKRFASELVNKVYLQALSFAFIKKCEEALGEFDVALEHWQKQLDIPQRGRKIIVLTNFNATPLGEALFEYCQNKNMLHICSQHGNGVELSLAGHYRYRYGEAANSGIYFTYNDVTTHLVYGFKETRAEVISVGQPRDLAEVSRHVKGGGPVADIYYISNQALFGHNMAPSSAGISELEAVEWEGEIIKKVLANLPHKVLYKPYRSRPYLDQNPLYYLAKAEKNITVYQGHLDLRYMLPNARVLVLTHAASTLGWCLMSGKPVVYINTPDQAKLFPDFELALKKGGIVVDADQPDFIDQLHSILSQPVELIEREWLAKTEVRKHVLEKFIGKGDGKAGRRMALEILKQNTNEPKICA